MWKPSDFVMLQLILAGNEQTQAAGRSADLCDLGYPADGSLVLLVILGAREGVRRAGRAAVDRSVGRSADVELGELVELDFDIVLRVAFTLRFDLAGLVSGD